MKFLEREARGIKKEGDGSWESEVSGREMMGSWGKRKKEMGMWL